VVCCWVETVPKAGLDGAISAALAPWRLPRAVHDPGKILLDVALAVALGGDCLADVDTLPHLRSAPFHATTWTLEKSHRCRSRALFAFLITHRTPSHVKGRG
jgi:hypothetical protein